MRYYTLEEVKGIRDGIKGLGNEPEVKGNELWEKGRKLRVKGKRLRLEDGKLRAKSIKLEAEGMELQAKGDSLLAESIVRLSILLTKICPQARYREWDSYLAIPKDEETEWVIPVFNGEYEGVAHEAYSIWSMPSRSCNSQDAVLFEEGRRKGGD